MAAGELIATPVFRRGRIVETGNEFLNSDEMPRAECLGRGQVCLSQGDGEGKKSSRGVLGLAVLALVLGPVLAAETSIKEVMKKAHAGAESLLASISTVPSGTNIFV